MSLPFRPRTLLCALSVSALAACGGGGGDSSSNFDALANQTPGENEMLVMGTSSEVNGVAASDRRLLLSQDAKLDNVTLLNTSAGRYTIGYRDLSGDGSVRLRFGHVEGDKTRYFIHAQTAESDASYECISTGWNEADHNAMIAAYGSRPPVCGSEISFDPTTNRLKMARGTLYSATSTNKLVLSLNTKVLDIDFKAAVN